MRKYVAPLQRNLISKTDQNFKTLHQTLSEYLTTGVLDVSNNPESYDFESAEEVDFNKAVSHDVDLYDAAAGHDDPFAGVGSDPGDPSIETPPAPAPDPTPSE